MWEQAEYWKDRAAGAIRNAKHKERPDVRARRIKGLEADKRKQEKIKAEAESEIRLAQSEIRVNQDLGLQDLITRLKLAISIHKIRLQAIAWVEQERLRKAKKLEKSKILDADLVFIVAYLMDEEDDAWITEIL